MTRVISLMSLEHNSNRNDHTFEVLFALECRFHHDFIFKRFLERWRRKGYL